MSGDCCSVDYSAQFDADEARRDLLHYRRDGATGSTRRLLDALRAGGVTGMSLLDIGGGIGVIQLELLSAGMVAATHVEASLPYLEVAREEARQRGLAQRVTYLHGDFVSLADQVDEADVVTLDRVICCYPDMPALVSRSVARARRVYALVYPVDRWWIRLLARMGNVALRLTRNPYRAHIHPGAEVDRLVRSAGLERSYHHAGLGWQTVVYRRVDGAETA